MLLTYLTEWIETWHFHIVSSDLGGEFARNLQKLAKSVQQNIVEDVSFETSIINLFSGAKLNVNERRGLCL